MRILGRLLAALGGLLVLAIAGVGHSGAYGIATPESLVEE